MNKVYSISEILTEVGRMVDEGKEVLPDVIEEKFPQLRGVKTRLGFPLADHVCDFERGAKVLLDNMPDAFQLVPGTVGHGVHSDGRKFVATVYADGDMHGVFEGSTMCHLIEDTDIVSWTQDYPQPTVNQWDKLSDVPDNVVVVRVGVVDGFKRKVVNGVPYTDGGHGWQESAHALSFLNTMGPWVKYVGEEG